MASSGLQFGIKMKTPLNRIAPNDPEARLLEGVSRSFALTIPELPPALGKTVTNAYLLCRIADTIEDEPGLSIQEKREFFRLLIDVVDRRQPAARFAGALAPRLGAHTLPMEKELIQKASVVFNTYFSLNRTQQQAVKRCLKIMSAGMLWFQETRNPLGLKTMGDMDQYCYHVAGVVGEMLTDLFCDHSPEAARHYDALFRLAPSFGQGLQMTNILKDLWDDRQKGACWLPLELFERHGFDLKDLSPGNHSAAFGEGLVALIAVTHRHLRNALAYTLLIPSREDGIRKFCLWAIGMAILTLQNLKKRPGYQSGQDVKISRNSVKAVILTANTLRRSDLFLKAVFKLAAAGLPLAGPIALTPEPLSDDLLSAPSLDVEYAP
jgi:farnesyl-diphosphate farnesyltransferase